MSLTKEHMFAEEETRHLRQENAYLAMNRAPKILKEILLTVRLTLLVVAITSLFLL